MAVVKFSVILVLLLYQLAVVNGEDASSKEAAVLDVPGASSGPGSAQDSWEITETDSNVEIEPDGVRCYCNTAQCVSTGYLCRSTPNGGCYSELPAPRRTHHARHGCLHHLADTVEEALSRCQNSPVPGAPPPSRQHSLLLCCFRDLCNHEDSPVARARLNFTTHELDGNAVASERGAGYNGEVWFKAATIAVPVCGALILFMLVAVAIRLLRADALLHADRKLRGGYMPPLAHEQCEDVKKMWVGGTERVLLAPGGCLVAVEHARLVSTTPSSHTQHPQHAHHLHIQR